MKLSLSILNIDYKNIEREFNEVIDYVDIIHMDVMDGVFVPNLSFGYDVIKSLRPLTTKPFDTHLMIVNPDKYIKKYADAGSDYITFHLEASDDPIKTINLIKECGKKAGISIRPNTKVEDLKPYLDQIDLILIMSVEPGFGGQSFMPSSIEKLKTLKEWKDKNNYQYLLSIDGGINNKTIKYVKDYLDWAVVGSFILCSEDKKERALSIKE